MAARFLDAYSSRSLSFLWLEITEKCNLACGHCYADSSPRRELFGQMRTEDWLEVLRQAVDAGCRRVQFIGGEPTLHPGLFQMISAAVACGYQFIEIFTNATALSDDHLGCFAASGVHVATSFYSDNADVHDSITERRGSFTRTVTGMKRILATGIPLRVGIIETSRNIGHAAKASRYLRGLGVSDINVGREREVGRGNHSARLTEPMVELCGECWKGKLCITPSGSAFPCVFCRSLNVGMAGDGICDILNGAALQDFRRSYRSFLGLDVEVPSLGFIDHTSDTPALGLDGVAREGCNPRCNPCAPDVFRRCMPEDIAKCVPVTHPPQCGPDRRGPSR